MILNYTNFINESISFKKIKNPQFLTDLNELLKQLIHEHNPNIIDDFYKNHENVLSPLDYWDGYDLLATHHNTGRIPKKLNISQQLYTIITAINDIYQFYKNNDQELADKLLNDPLFFILNTPVKVYRGIHNMSNDNREILEKGKYKSFTLDFDIALKFTQRSWVYRGFLDINARNGYVLMAEITLSDLYMFNNVGDELECVVKGEKKYIKKFKIKNGKVEETIDL